LVLDKLNVHLRESFEEVLGMKTAATLLRRIELHYTPNHASWLNMPESRSVCCSVNAWRAVLPSDPPSPPRWLLGSDGATPLDVGSSGRFRDLALEILEQRFERAKGSEQSDVPTPGRL